MRLRDRRHDEAVLNVGGKLVGLLFSGGREVRRRQTYEQLQSMAEVLQAVECHLTRYVATL